MGLDYDEIAKAAWETIDNMVKLGIDPEAYVDKQLEELEK